MYLTKQHVVQPLQYDEQMDFSVTVKYNEESFRILAKSKGILKRIQSLEPFINEVTSSSPIISIYCLDNDIPEEYLEKIYKEGEEIPIDESLYQTSSKGLKYKLKDKSYFIYIFKTKTLLHFLPQKEKIYIFNPNKKLLCTEATRLLKSLISISAEYKGQLMLHASGIVNSKGGTLFLGDSRNGKTTILLEALTNFSCEMLSCDTSFLRIENNQLKARGWPSNFSVSVGTMYDYKCLHSLIPSKFLNKSYSDAWKIYDKHVLDTKDVIKNLNTQIHPESVIDSIIALNFNPKSKQEIIPLTDCESIKNWIKKVYLGSRDILYPNWHQCWVTENVKIESNIDQLVKFIQDKKIRFYQMDWAPAPHTFLRRIPALDFSHQLYSSTRG